ncbi:MAG: hypothetical protein HY905_20510 [Deltaproteobacteria bacterium]|nr:hypothetical protein [Deltaproteobacteria bacterium]
MRSSPSWSGALLTLVVAVGACQRARPSAPPPPDATADPAASGDAGDAVVPAERPGGIVPGDGTGAAGADETGEMPGPDDAGPAPDAAEAPAGDAFDTGYNSHCLEPPERDVARRQMREMADRHAQATERLSALRDEFETRTTGILADLSLEVIDAVAAEFVPRLVALHGGERAGAGSLAVLLHQAASVAVLCRALRAGPQECDRPDAAAFGDPGNCRATVRLLELARERPGTIGLRSFLTLTLGWQDEAAAADLIWQVALRGLPESWCDRLAVPGSPDHWALPLCRSVAARDASRCTAFQGEWRRTTCGALVHALLGPEESGADAPDALAALLREWVAAPESGPTCEAAARRVLDQLLDASGIFDPGRLVLPDAERNRGLAPTS